MFVSLSVSWAEYRRRCRDVREQEWRTISLYLPLSPSLILLCQKLVMAYAWGRRMAALRSVLFDLKQLLMRKMTTEFLSQDINLPPWHWLIWHHRYHSLLLLMWCVIIHIIKKSFCTCFAVFITTKFSKKHNPSPGCCTLIRNKCSYSGPNFLIKILDIRGWCQGVTPPLTSMK